MSLIWRKQILCPKGATISFFRGGVLGLKYCPDFFSNRNLCPTFYFHSFRSCFILAFFYINCHAVLSFGIVSRLTFFHSNLPVLPFFADCIQAPLKLEWHDSSLRLTQFHMHTNKPYVNVWYCKSFQITCSETLNLCGNLFQPWN